MLALDEVQKVPRWSEAVKARWNDDTLHGRLVRVVLLGSAPLLVQPGLTESLAGRFELLRVPHWSHAEMREAFGWDVERYVIFGGYPGARGDDPLPGRAADEPGGQASVVTAALRSGARVLGSRAQLHQDAGPAPGRGQHDDARPLPDAARGRGTGRRLAEIRGRRGSAAGLQPQAVCAQHRARHVTGGRGPGAAPRRPRGLGSARGELRGRAPSEHRARGRPGGLPPRPAGSSPSEITFRVRARSWWVRVRARSRWKTSWRGRRGRRSGEPRLPEAANVVAPVDGGPRRTTRRGGSGPRTWRASPERPQRRVVPE